MEPGASRLPVSAWLLERRAWVLSAKKLILSYCFRLLSGDLVQTSLGKEFLHVF